MNENAEVGTVSHDEQGRPIAADGYPVSGLAKISDLVAVTGVSRSKIYQYMTDGTIPSVSFGRSRRVQWPVIRRMFLTPSVEVSA